MDLSERFKRGFLFTATEGLARLIIKRTDWLKRAEHSGIMNVGREITLCLI